MDTGNEFTESTRNGASPVTRVWSPGSASETDVAYSSWLPEPPADPVFLRRVSRVRWEKAAVASALVAGWGGAAYLVFFTRHYSGIMGCSAIFVGLTAAAWQKARTLRAAPVLSDLIDLPAVVAQFPVEVDYKVQQWTYGVDQGVVSVIDGWFHFQGRRTSWSVHSRDVLHVGPRVLKDQQKSGYSPPPYSHRLDWDSGGSSFSVCLLAMNSMDGLGSGLQDKLEATLDLWDRYPGHKIGDTLWPPTEAMPGTVLRTEKQYALLCRLKLVAHASWLTGVALVVTGNAHSFLTQAVPFLFGLPALVFGEYHRGKLAERLEAIYSCCEGGSREVSFRRGQGPWWRRIRKPWVI